MEHWYSKYAEVFPSYILFQANAPYFSASCQLLCLFGKQAISASVRENNSMWTLLNTRKLVYIMQMWFCDFIFLCNLHSLEFCLFAWIFFWRDSSAEDSVFCIQSKQKQGRCSNKELWEFLNEQSFWPNNGTVHISSEY